MLKCWTCGSDTILCVSGEPICIACDDRLQASERETLKEVGGQGEQQAANRGGKALFLNRTGRATPPTVRAAWPNKGAGAMRRPRRVVNRPGDETNA
jgi:hypothetical protein